MATAKYFLDDLFDKYLCNCHMIIFKKIQTLFCQSSIHKESLESIILIESESTSGPEDSKNSEEVGNWIFLDKTDSPKTDRRKYL